MCCKQCNMCLLLFHIQPQPPQSGFDIALFFDVSSDEVFKRSSSADGMSVLYCISVAWCGFFIPCFV